jgi:hypothetical protein
MKRLLYASLLLALLALPVGVAVADEDAEADALMELLRSELRADKKALVTASMDLSDADADVFWPIYEKYEQERTVLGDRTVDLIKRYPDAVNLTGTETLRSLSVDWFKLQDDRISLMKKYYKKMEKQTSLRVAVRWMQIEHRLSLMINLQIVSQIPMVVPINR